MKKNILTAKNKYFKCKKQLEAAVKKGRDVDQQIFLDFFRASLDLKAAYYQGRVEPIQKNGVIIAWVKYKDFDIDSFSNNYFADAFLTTAQLEEFAENPFKYIPRGTEPQNVYIYGMFESFESDVAPHIIKLYHHGANSITYFGWDFDRKKYTPIDAVDVIHTLVEMVSEPSLYKDFKQRIKDSNNGLYDIESLAYIKNLKRLAAAI